MFLNILKLIKTDLQKQFIRIIIFLKLFMRTILNVKLRKLYRYFNANIRFLLFNNNENKNYTAFLKHIILFVK